jgi:hypothetical protein
MVSVVPTGLFNDAREPRTASWDKFSQGLSKFDFEKCLGSATTLYEVLPFPCHPDPDFLPHCSGHGRVCAFL